MVSSIAVLNNSVNHQGTMAGPSPLSDPSLHNSRNKKIPSSPNAHERLYCDRSRSAAVDCVFLIAVVCASGFLLYPYISLCFNGIVEVVGAVLSVVKFEVRRAPLVCMFVGLSLVLGLVVVWGICNCISPKCRRRNCHGLRNAAEFDIQIETEETMKNSSTSLVRDYGKGIFRLSHEHHREIELELRKMAPPNGRVVLMFRKKCGCPIGRMVVAGPKVRKIKK
ncbi:hypothetical protein Sjap_015658 [Stephania japonica]|uniref:Ribosomal protein L34e superfamily protein n=1 Tax=Stephania japonica TaxID=461633 RepID=A0AAP0NU66_9MAGN